MPEANEAAIEQTQEQEISEVEPHGEAQEIDWKAEARKWEKRAKENKAHAEANQKAADQLAELEEAKKTELEKANERAANLQKQLDEIEQERERAKAVAAAAKEYGVDAEILSAMSGDIEANAEMLKERMKPSGYPNVYDSGEQAKQKPKPREIPTVI